MSGPRARAVYLEARLGTVRLGAAEHAAEEAPLAISTEQGLMDRLSVESEWGGQEDCTAAPAAVPAAALSDASSPDFVTSHAERLAAAEARAAALDAERLALLSRLAASNARATAPAEVQTPARGQHLAVAEHSREDVLERHGAWQVPEREEWIRDVEQEQGPLAIRQPQGHALDAALQEECAVLRRQLLQEGRRRGRLEARVAALERERDRLWEQLSTEEAKRVQVEAQAAAFEREWDAARARLATEQVRRERAEEERNSLLQSPQGAAVQSPEVSPTNIQVSRWRFPVAQEGYPWADRSALDERLVTEESKREQAEARVAALEETVNLLSQRLEGLKAVTPGSPGSPLACRSLEAQLAAERARREQAEARANALERQLAAVTLPVANSFDTAVLRPGTGEEVHGELGRAADFGGTGAPQRQPQLVERAGAERAAYVPWPAWSAVQQEEGGAPRSDAADVATMRRELDDAQACRERDARRAAQHQQQAKAEAHEREAEAAEAAVLRQRLADTEVQMAASLHRAVQEEGITLQERFAPIVEAMQQQIEAHRQDGSLLRERLAAEDGQRSRDLQELTALRERLAGSELDSAMRRAVQEGRTTLQQQLSPLVRATQQQMGASRAHVSELRGQLAAEEDKWLEEATEVVALRRRLAATELNAERALQSTMEEEKQLALARSTAKAEAVASNQRLEDVEQRAEETLCKAVQEESATLQQQLAPIVDAAQQQITTYREDCFALRGQLATAESGRQAEGVQAAALRQRLASAESGMELLERRAAWEAEASLQECTLLKDELAAEEGRRSAQAEASKRQCARLTEELGMEEAKRSTEVAILEKRLANSMLDGDRAAQAAAQCGGQLALAEDRGSAEAAEANALQQQLSEAELGAERALRRAVQAESAKLHGRFTPVVEAAQQQVKAFQEDCTTLRVQLVSEEERTREEAEAVAALQQRVADREVEAAVSLRTAVQEEGDSLKQRFTPIMEAAQQQIEANRLDLSRLRWQLDLEEGGHHAEAEVAAELRERLAAAELEAQEAARRAAREEAAALRQRFTPVVQAAQQQIEVHREDCAALQSRLAEEEGRREAEASRAVVVREQLTTTELSTEEEVRRAVQEECATLEQRFVTNTERMQQKADAFREDCLALQGQLVAAESSSTAAAAEVVALTRHLAERDLDVEGAVQRATEWDERLAVVESQKAAEAKEVSALRQRLLDAEQSARQAARRAVQEENASLQQRVYPAVEAARQRAEDYREDCYNLRGQLAVEEGRRMAEAAELASLRGQLTAAKVDALEAARRAVHEEGAAFQERIVPIMDASREDCFALRRQLAVEEGAKMAEGAEVAALRQRMIEAEAEAAWTASKAAQAEKAFQKHLAPTEQECSLLRDELRLERCRRAAEAEEADTLRQRLSSAELGALEATKQATLSEGAACKEQLAPLLAAAQASRESISALQSQLAAEQARGRQEAAEVVALRRRLTDTELDAERAMREALQEEGATLQQWLTPILESSQEDCSTLREQLTAEEDRRKAKAAEVIALQQRLADSELGSQRFGHKTAQDEGAALSQLAPIMRTAQHQVEAAHRQMEVYREDCAELRRRLVAEEGRQAEGAAELSALREVLEETELGAQRGLALIMEASCEERAKHQRELSAGEDLRLAEATEVAALQQRLLYVVAALKEHLTAPESTADEVMQWALREGGAANGRGPAAADEVLQARCAGLQEKLVLVEGECQAWSAEVAALGEQLAEAKVQEEADVAQCRLSPTLEALQADCSSLQRQLATEAGGRRAQAAEAAALRRQLECADMEGEQAALVAAYEEERSKELQAQCSQLSKEHAELKQELTAAVVRQRKEHALEVAARHEEEACSLGFEAQRAELLAALASEEMRRERTEAWVSGIREGWDSLVAEAPGDALLGLPTKAWPSSTETAFFCRRLAAADEASEQQMAMDIELEKSLILRAMGSQQPNGNGCCTPGGSPSPPTPVSC